ncbi:MAG: hypothetical protein V1766_09890 [Pseudomonadota bacterium]
MPIHHYRGLINCLNMFFRNHIEGPSGHLYAPLIQENDPVAVQRGQVDVMRDGNHRQALCQVQCFDEIEKFHLMPNVQRGGRFVKQHQFGLLGQRARDQNPLPLAAAQPVHAPACERQRIGHRHRPVDDRQVLFSLETPFSEIRRPPHKDNLLHLERKNRRGFLGHDGNDSGQGLAFHLVDGYAMNADHAFL